MWNLTPILCSKPGLAIRGFAIHIQIFLERNPREYQGKPVDKIDLPAVSIICLTLLDLIRHYGLNEIILTFFNCSQQ